MHSIKINTLISFTFAFLSTLFILLAPINLSESSLDTDFDSIISSALLSTTFLNDLMLGFSVLLIIHLLLALFANTCLNFLNFYFKKDHKLSFILIWFLICLAIITGNSALYPSTLMTTPQSIGIIIFPIVSILLASFFFLGLLKSSKKIQLLCLSILLISFLPYSKINIENSYTKNLNTVSEKPNIIIIGIDSLRPDMVTQKLTPFVWAFSKKNKTVNKITTPAARTFTAWYSILSGIQPVNSGARFNLTQQSSLPKITLLSDSLKKEGYTTIYSQDERRFNSIGYGQRFDMVLGPPANAAEFIFSGFHNLPQVALAVNIKVFHYLFPYIKGNRAAHRTYEPIDFIEYTSEKIVKTQQPLFLATHFTLPHYPFKIRVPTFVEDEVFDVSNPYPYLYKSMLLEVDKQVELYINKLKLANLLDNSILIILSDHGESLFDISDGPTNAIKGAKFETNTQGHGSNVLSHTQFNVFLSTELNGNTRHCEEIFTTQHEINYSLVDVRPSIERCLRIKGKADYDGLPFSEVPNLRPTFIESSINPVIISKNRIDEIQTLANGVIFYTIDKDGKVIVKPAIYDKAVAAKQRAIILKDFQLAAFPDMHDNLVVTDLKIRKWYPASHYKDKELVKSMFSLLCSNFKSDVEAGLFHQCNDESAFIKKVYK